MVASVRQTVSRDTENSQPGDSNPLAQTRPRLRHDVVFADSGDGAYVRHSDRSFFIKGRLAYRWLSHLAPHLTGEYTVADLCEGLSDERQAMVRGLVESLLDRGFARSARADDNAALAEPQLQGFAEQIGYVEHYADDAITRFTRFATARVLVVGAGESAHALGAGLLRNGLRQLDVVGEHDFDADVASLRDQGQQPVVRKVTRERADAELSSYDLVVAVCGGAERLHETIRFTNAAMAAGTTVLPLIVFGRRALTGPIVRPASTPCLTCGLLRIGASLPGTEAGDLWRAASFDGALAQTAPLPAPIARMLGVTVAFEVFRELTGCIVPETDRGMIVQDLEIWESARDVLLPHPLCPVCGDFQADVVGGSADTDLPVVLDEHEAEEAKLRAQSALVSPHLGIASEFRDGAIDQAPVKVARLHLNPPGRQGADGRDITAFDIETVTGARHRLLRTAALTYVDTIADPRAVATADVSDRVRPEILQTFSHTGNGGEGMERWVAARSLVSGQARLVPFDAVYPFGPLARTRQFEPTRAGAGCGDTLTEATVKGLLSAFTYQALRAAITGDAKVLRCQDEQLAESAEASFLVKSAAHLDRRVDLLAIVGTQPLPVVLAIDATPGSTVPLWAIGTGWSTVQAANVALRDLVGQIQLHAGTDGPVSVDLGNPLMADFDPRALAVATGDLAGPVLDQAAELDRDGQLAWLVEQVNAHGQDAFVVPTTTSDLRAVGLVETVRVLLTDIDRLAR